MDQVATETLPYAPEFTLSLNGEPLSSPDFDQIIERLSGYGAKMDLVTNGTLFTAKRVARLIPVLARLEISIDGATKLAVEAIRKGARYEKLLHNIRTAVKAVARLEKQDDISIMFSYTVMGSNIRELPLIVELAAALGVLRVNCSFIVLHYDSVRNEGVEKHKPLYNHYRGEAMVRAEELGVRLVAPSPFPGVAPCSQAPMGGDGLIIQNFPPDYYENVEPFESLIDEAKADASVDEILEKIDENLRAEHGSADRPTLKWTRSEEDALQECVDESMTRFQSELEELANSPDAKVKYCSYLDKALYIGPGGHITPCCIEGRPVLGNANQDSIEDIYNGAEYRHFLDSFHSDNPHPSCVGCKHINYRSAREYLTSKGLTNHEKPLDLK